MFSNKDLNAYDTINFKSSSVCKETCKNGICLNFGDGHNLVCTCKEGWKGENCDIPINNCKETCKNGICLNFGDGHNLVCTCNPGFTGKNCDKPVINPYDPNTIYPADKYSKCGKYHCMREGTRFCDKSTINGSCICIDDYTGPQCETLKPYQPPSGKPKCDSVNSSSGYNRVEIGWTSNNCNNISMTEPDFNVETTTLAGRQRIIRNKCANYYYSPFVGGTDVICDGVPVKKGTLEWECTNGTTCKT